MSLPIRVVLVDDHVIVHRGLATLLELYDDISVVAEAKSGRAALDIIGDTCPDVVLMDIKMPGMDGIETIQAARSICPDAKLLAMTSFTGENHVESALKAGADGYLMKDMTGKQLADAIRRAHAGESVVAPAAQDLLMASVARGPVPGSDLTEREYDVLNEMIQGYSNREIAERLFISPSTVKNHVSSILSKLGTTSRTRAVALAVEHNLVDND